MTESSSCDFCNTLIESDIHLFREFSNRQTFLVLNYEVFKWKTKDIYDQTKLR